MHSRRTRATWPSHSRNCGGCLCTPRPSAQWFLPSWGGGLWRPLLAANQAVRGGPSLRGGACQVIPSDPSGGRGGGAEIRDGPSGLSRYVTARGGMVTGKILAGLFRLVLVLIDCEGNSPLEGILRVYGFQSVPFACDWSIACACAGPRLGPLRGLWPGAREGIYARGLCPLLAPSIKSTLRYPLAPRLGRPRLERWLKLLRFLL